MDTNPDPVGAVMDKLLFRIGDRVQNKVTAGVGRGYVAGTVIDRFLPRQGPMPEIRLPYYEILLAENGARFYVVEPILELIDWII